MGTCRCRIGIRSRRRRAGSATFCARSFTGRFPRRRSMEIHLVRHGRSALVHDGSWFRWTDVGSYEDAYDAHGIRDDDGPGDELHALVARKPLLVASDLPRAIASAQRLAPEGEIQLSPLLREIRLEPPRWVPLRLPIQVWDAFSH